MKRISKPPEVRRQELLNTAMELFTQKGYEETSMGDIAKAAGVAQGLCYRYFDSKQKLFQEAMDQYVHTCCAGFLPVIHDRSKSIQTRLEEMARLIRMLAADSGYEKILVDVGQMGKGALPILRICDAIYMPVRDDYISMAKVEEFETYLKAAGGDRVLERIRKLRLPHQGLQVRRENYMEQLLWGELGDYVRRLLRKSGTDGI